MSQERRTQKQIAERYKGNLDYYKKKHPFARTALSFLVIGGTLIGVILFHERGQRAFFSAGPTSNNHKGKDCAQCHDPALATAANFWQVVGDRFQRGVTFEGIDGKCETCHKSLSNSTYLFHEPNVVDNRSCSACHLEHQGPSKMKAVASLNCASCHNSRAIMQASGQKGMQLPKSDFHPRAQPSPHVVFNLSRPPEGFTQVFASFASGHPEFQFIREKARDSNTLKFNHKRHYEEDIPEVNGTDLRCDYCHKPAGDGRYMQRISFATNCQACHALQFDPRNPDLTLPHGDPAAVRVFLQTLPIQYEMLAVKKGMTNPDEARSFAATQMRESVPFAEDQIFFSIDPSRPQPEQVPPTRSSFKGCAFCHEVKPSATGPPIVTKPVLPEIWMPHAHFNHAKHTKKLDCDACHDGVKASQQTSDILLPAKAKCSECHKVGGKGEIECVTCHSYHATPTAETVARSDATMSFKQLLLGP